MSRATPRRTPGKRYRPFADNLRRETVTRRNALRGDHSHDRRYDVTTCHVTFVPVLNGRGSGANDKLTVCANCYWLGMSYAY